MGDSPQWWGESARVVLNFPFCILIRGQQNVRSRNFCSAHTHRRILEFWAGQTLLQFAEQNSQTQNSLKCNILQSAICIEPHRSRILLFVGFRRYVFTCSICMCIWDYQSKSHDKNLSFEIWNLKSGSFERHVSEWKLISELWAPNPVLLSVMEAWK